MIVYNLTIILLSWMSYLKSFIQTFKKKDNLFCFIRNHHLTLKYTLIKFHNYCELDKYRANRISEQVGQESPL